MTEKAEQFFSELKSAVESDQLVLPTLPEVALKIREAVESEDTSAQQVAEIMTQDASLSARLIQVSNSPLYRSRTPIEDLQMAVTRLGIRMVKDLVVSLAMKQIYQATSDVLMTTSDAAGMHLSKSPQSVVCWPPPFLVSTPNRHYWPG